VDWIVKNAEVKGDYEIFLEFQDGTSGVLDFKKKIETDHREVIKELIDKEKFKAIKLELDTVCWENGADFAPEYLYENIKHPQGVFC